MCIRDSPKSIEDLSIQKPGNPKTICIRISHEFIVGKAGDQSNDNQAALWEHFAIARFLVWSTEG